MKLFWSWQSDTPGKIGRHFIRRALDSAVEELKRDLSLVEPSEREAVEDLYVDQDRQGVAGSSDLFPEILKKIAAADFFVADVTCVGVLEESLADIRKDTKPKRLINSNVAIELGYAYQQLSNSFVLLVMNAHYGKHEDLPFDLKHKGGTIAFTLAPDAAKAEIERVWKTLRRRLVDEIGLCISARGEEGTKHTAPPASFEAANTGAGSAFYFPRGEILATPGLYGEQKFVFKEDRAIYLRLFPVYASRSLGMARVVRDFATGKVFPMSEGTGGINERNKYGAIAFDIQGTDTIIALTQGFGTGELWGVNGRVLQSQAIGESERTIVPIRRFEEVFVKTLTNYVAIATRLFGFSPPFTAIMGVWGLINARLVGPGRPYWESGPIYDSAYQQIFTLEGADDASIREVLRAFFSGFYDLAAVSRDQMLSDGILGADD
jgi:hypothetical protein